MSRGFGSVQVYALRFLLEVERLDGEDVGAPVPFITRAKYRGFSPEFGASLQFNSRNDMPGGSSPGEAMRRALTRLQELGLVVVERTAGHGWNFASLTDAGRRQARRLADAATEPPRLLGKREWAVLSHVAGTDMTTARETAQRTGGSELDAAAALRALRKAGFVRERLSLEDDAGRPRYFVVLEGQQYLRDHGSP